MTQQHTMAAEAPKPMPVADHRDYLLSMISKLVNGEGSMTFPKDTNYLNHVHEANRAIANACLHSAHAVQAIEEAIQQLIYARAAAKWPMSDRLTGDIDKEYEGERSALACLFLHGYCFDSYPTAEKTYETGPLLAAQLYGAMRDGNAPQVESKVQQTMDLMWYFLEQAQGMHQQNKGIGKAIPVEPGTSIAEAAYQHHLKTNGPGTCG